MVCGHDPGRIRKNPSTRWGFDSEVQAINEHLIVVRDELGSARLHFFFRKQEDAGFTGFSSRGAARVAVKHIGRVVTARIAIRAIVVADFAIDRKREPCLLEEFALGGLFDGFTLIDLAARPREAARHGESLHRDEFSLEGRDRIGAGDHVRLLHTEALRRCR